MLTSTTAFSHPTNPILLRPTTITISKTTSTGTRHSSKTCPGIESNTNPTASKNHAKHPATRHSTEDGPNTIPTTPFPPGSNLSSIKSRLTSKPTPSPKSDSTPSYYDSTSTETTRSHGIPMEEPFWGKTPPLPV